MIKLVEAMMNIYLNSRFFKYQSHHFLEDLDTIYLCNIIKKSWKILVKIGNVLKEVRSFLEKHAMIAPFSPSLPSFFVGTSKMCETFSFLFFT